MGRRFIELDPMPEIRTHWIRRAIAALRERRAAAPRKFGPFLGLSLLTHLVVFGILLVMAEAPAPTPADAYRANVLAFSRALEQMRQAPGRVRLDLAASPSGERKGLEEDIGSLFRFEKDISESDKVRFFRSILEAGGIFGANSRLDTEIGAFFVARAAAGDAYEVDKIDRATMEKLGRLAADAEASKAGPSSGEAADTPGAELGPADVPREYLLRDCPYAEILARGPRLFTVFDGFPDLGDLNGSSSPGAGDRSVVRPYDGAPSPRPAGVMLLTVRPSFSGEAQRPPVLSLPPAERGRILDELMTMDEPDQLEAFKTRYLEVYDPGRGDLAALAREFFYSNLNGVFVVTDPVTSAFDAVEGIHLRRPVYEVYSTYGRRWLKNETGAALLFNLASSYDFERRTLEALFAAGDEARRILSGSDAVPGKHLPRLKAYVISGLSEEVAELAGRMRLSLEALSALYLRRQEEIYRHLAGLGGEIMNRALYDWGRLDWERGRYEDAYGKWRRADRTCVVPSRTFRRILGLIDRYDITKSATALGDVGTFLSSEESLDKQALLARHQKFGTWKKRDF